MDGHPGDASKYREPNQDGKCYKQNRKSVLVYLHGCSCFGFGVSLSLSCACGPEERDMAISGRGRGWDHARPLASGIPSKREIISLNNVTRSLRSAPLEMKLQRPEAVSPNGKTSSTNPTDRS